MSVSQTYDDLYRNFRWDIPEHFNIGVDTCDKWAISDPSRRALSIVSETGAVRDYSFDELRALSNRVANLLKDLGAERGDRIAILLPQMLETAIAHIAIYKIGAIALPLFVLFGPEAITHRLADSGAKIIITDAQGAQKLHTIRDEVPDLRHIISVDEATESINLHDALSGQSDHFIPVNTRAVDPAILIYTSGTTGLPKGALHAHAVLLGHLPGVEMSHDFLPQPGDCMWTPADWAWIGGLLDVLLPSLHHGVPVIARRFAKFSGEAALDLMARHGVRNAFIPPTALKMMRAVPEGGKHRKLQLRSLASGGESLGSELISWGRRVLGVTINEFYGQTECNMIVSSCASILDPKVGAMGKPVPGHDVAIVDEDGKRCAPGSLGMIAVRRPDPVMFLGYWNNPAATMDKFVGDWLITGDVGVCNSEGWLTFIGRNDDVITSSGYRIGPGEIENCLLRHPAVELAAVVGVPDEQRTEIVKAFIVLKRGYIPTMELKDVISQFVRTQLAAHEYPREIEFVASLPMTATGKIIRSGLRSKHPTATADSSPV